ncbi:MAG: hypothetical protein PVI80_19750 [Anaerolineae bacterium]|jgi:uncharacterized membrane protein
MSTTTEDKPTTIEVSPSKIVKTVKRGETYAEPLTVRNTGEERSSFDVKADGEYRSWVDPDPNLFGINAQDEREITLELRPPQGAKIGTHRFKTRVTNAEQEDDQAEVDMALRIPMSLIGWILLAIFVLIVILLVVIALILLPGSEGLL